MKRAGPGKYFPHNKLSHAFSYVLFLAGSMYEH